jgi:hypothetical protein
MSCLKKWNRENVTSELAEVHLFQEMVFGCEEMTDSLMMKERVVRLHYFGDVEEHTWQSTFIIAQKELSLPGNHIPNNYK